MKLITRIIFIFLFISVNLFAQDDKKTVTLVVSGQGITQDIAKQVALRNAIEQAFGTFISSNTDILNDELVKDEIVSVSNGNIQKFEIISDIKIKDGKYYTTLKATVSVSKLTSFVKSKGIEVEFKGSLFSFNIKQQELNKTNEEKSINNLYTIVSELASTSFDYEISVSNPVLKPKSKSKIYVVKSYVSVFANKNFTKIPDLIYSTLDELSLNEDEVKDYNNTGTPIYGISASALKDSKSKIFYLRSENSYSSLVVLMASFKISLLNFVVSNSIYNYHILDNPYNVDYIYDGGFQVFQKYNYVNTAVAKGGFLYKRSLFYRKTLSTRSSMKKYNKVGLDIDMKYYNLSNNDKMSKLSNDDIDGYYGIPIDMNYSRYKNEKSFYGIIDRNINGVYDIVLVEGGYVAPTNFNSRYLPDDKVYCRITFNRIDIKSELLRIYFSDYVTLDDIDKIQEYSVKPYNESIKLDLVRYNEEGIKSVIKY